MPLNYYRKKGRPLKTKITERFIQKEEEKDRKIERQKLQTLKSKIIIKSRRKKKTVEAKF